MTTKAEEKDVNVQVNVQVDAVDNALPKPAAVSEDASVNDQAKGGVGMDAEAIKALAANDPEKGKVVYKTFVAELKAAKKDDFTAEIVISTGDIDRDRERVDPKGIYVAAPKRVPLVAGHSYGDLRKHIGDVPRIKRGDNEVTAVARWLVGQGNSEADWGWNLATQGLAAFSIGFLPEEWAKADITDEKVMEKIRAGKVPIREYTKCELVEVSQVIVPSNRAAIQRLEAEGILSKELTAAALERAKDGEMSEAAQRAFDAALAAWKKAPGTEMVDEKGAHDDDCPEGQHAEDGECVDDKAEHEDDCPEGQHLVDGECVDKKKGVEETDPWKFIEQALAAKPPVKKKPEAKKPDDKGKAAFQAAVDEVLTEVRGIGEAMKEGFTEKIKEQVDSALKEAGLTAPIPAGSAAFLTAKEFAAELFTHMNRLVDEKIAKAQGNVDAFRDKI